MADNLTSRPGMSATRRSKACCRLGRLPNAFPSTERLKRTRVLSSGLKLTKSTTPSTSCTSPQPQLASSRKRTPRRLNASRSSTATRKCTRRPSRGITSARNSKASPRMNGFCRGGHCRRISRVRQSSSSQKAAILSTSRPSDRSKSSTGGNLMKAGTWLRSLATGWNGSRRR